MAFLLPRFGGILADEMGLGKSMQAISSLRLLVHSGQARSVLIICPKGLVSNWSRELSVCPASRKPLLGNDLRPMLYYSLGISKHGCTTVHSFRWITVQHMIPAIIARPSIFKIRFCSLFIVVSIQRCTY
jgi:hypothetical protein